MTNSTKGPWKTEIGIEGMMVVNDEGVVICDNVQYYPQSVSEEDMILIAAAPDMLGILEKCLKDELNRRKKLLNKSTAAAYSDARTEKMKQIIAKAKGLNND